MKTWNQPKIEELNLSETACTDWYEPWTPCKPQNPCKPDYPDEEIVNSLS